MESYYNLFDATTFGCPSQGKAIGFHELWMQLLNLVEYHGMQFENIDLSPLKKVVSVTRKCHNHPLQNNQGHCNQETKDSNGHMTARRQLE